MGFVSPQNLNSTVGRTCFGLFEPFRASCWGLRLGRKVHGFVVLRAHSRFPRFGVAHRSFRIEAFAPAWHQCYLWLSGLQVRCPRPGNLHHLGGDASSNFEQLQSDCLSRRLIFIIVKGSNTPKPTTRSPMTQQSKNKMHLNLLRWRFQKRAKRQTFPTYGSFPKLGVPILGVPIIRITYSTLRSILGSPYLGNHHISL